MEIVHAVLWMLAACIGLALLARRFDLPYAVVLIVGGMVLAFMPGLPDVQLDPDVALAFFLPPLLMASAYRTDWRAFRRNLRPILLLAVGCVIFTAFATAWVAKMLLPELPWAAAIALGAILAPPDAVAAAAVLQKLNLPRRIVTVLEGESLLNDGSSLVLYRLAVAAALAGASAPAWQVAGSFVLVAIGGVVVGFIAAKAMLWAIRRTHEPLLDTATSFVACYVSFLGAEALHLSGVLAVVTTGIMIGQSQHHAFSARTRIEARHVWQFIEFVLTSLVFILIGLSLNDMLDRLAERGWAELLWQAAVISAALIATRFLWVFPTAYASRLVPAVRRADPAPPMRHLVINSWSGMRGVVSLAVALALPQGFPERDLIVFLAFAAILVTLVLQGTTLTWLIRVLRVAEPRTGGGLDPAEARARHVVASAQLAAIEARTTDIIDGPIAADLLGEYRDRSEHLGRSAAGGGAAAAEREARRRIRLDALEVARAALMRHRREEGLHDEALVKLSQELDLEELRLRHALGEGAT
ncbi:MAG: Na+/H+ antiporter [Alphaproteobacteria bacterium]|nr:Na+/H+ antiporter [Alphaproteobacteria bacterium]